MTKLDRLALRHQNHAILAGRVIAPFAALGYLYAVFILMTNAPILLGFLIVASHIIVLLGHFALEDKQSGHRPE